MLPIDFKRNFCVVFHNLYSSLLPKFDYVKMKIQKYPSHMLIITKDKSLSNKNYLLIKYGHNFKNAF